LRFTNLDVIIVPAELFVRLETGQELGFDDEKGYSGDETAANKINGIVMR